MEKTICRPCLAEGGVNYISLECGFYASEVAVIQTAVNADSRLLRWRGVVHVD